MVASDYLHALTVAWFYEPSLPSSYTSTSEIYGDLAVLRDRDGYTLATVNIITDNAITDRQYLKQFDRVSE